MIRMIRLAEANGSDSTLFQSAASIDHNGRQCSLLLPLIVLPRIRLVRVQLLPHLLDRVVLVGQHLLEVPVGPRLAELLLQLLLCHVQLVLDLEEPGEDDKMVLSNLLGGTARELASSANV